MPFGYITPPNRVPYTWISGHGEGPRVWKAKSEMFNPYSHRNLYRSRLKISPIWSFIPQYPCLKSNNRTRKHPGSQILFYIFSQGRLGAIPSGMVRISFLLIFLHRTQHRATQPPHRVRFPSIPFLFGAWLSRGGGAFERSCTFGSTTLVSGKLCRVLMLRVFGFPITRWLFHCNYLSLVSFDFLQLLQI